MRPRLLALSLLLAPARASRCNGDAQPGAPNLHPIDTAPPVFVRAVPNGKLYSVGPAGDVKDLVHVWGTPYENGYAMGQLLAHKLKKFLPEVTLYFESQFVPKLANDTWCHEHRFRCGALKEVLQDGLTAALNLSYHMTAPYIKPYVMEEIRGLAAGGGVDEVQLRNLMWLGELTRGACSMFGAKDSATPDGNLLQLRALDWDVDGPFRNYHTIVVYHPTPGAGDGHAFANLAFTGYTASITGFSAAKLGISEIGVSYPDASFGSESYLARGYPFGFLIRDVLQFDASLDEATQRITNAKRTCDLILGVGDGDANDFSGFQYSSHVATVVKPDSLLPVNDTWHPPVTDVVYWGMDWICPNDNRMLAHQLTRHHGNLTAALTISDVVSYVSTGDVHVAVYDYAAMTMHVATARPDGSDGPLEAYKRQFTSLDMTALFAEKPPSLVEVDVV